MNISRGNRNIMLKYKNILFRATPARMIFFGFAALILFGSVLLALPISAKNGVSIGLIDALFTATSSVCVTGLVVVDTNTYWSLFGKIVILSLIQIGALGIMSVVTLFSVLTGKTLGLSQRLAIKESISYYSLENVVIIFKEIFKITFAVEGIGALIIAADLIPAYGLAEGIARGVFQSVSAFCNAGFDVFGTDSAKYVSLSGFQEDPLMLLTTSVLIILGGLGFIVWNDMLANRRFSRMALHTKIVLVMTGILLASGTFLYLMLESGNTMRALQPHYKFLNAFFHSVSARTAGFNALPLDQMEPASNLITIILMFIGAAPGSTAGGIKTTTFFVLILAVAAFLRGRSDVQAFERRIAAEVVHKAVAIFILSLALILLTTIVLLINHEGGLLETLFEATSAFGTVGLSTGITPGLSNISKLQLVITMLLGRVGTITAFAAFTTMQGRETIAYRCPEGNITVG